MNIVSKRIANVIELGRSLALVLTYECDDMKLQAGNQVAVTIEQSDEGRKVIVIEKVAKEK
jgi:hypothetical protein